MVRRNPQPPNATGALTAALRTLATLPADGAAVQLAHLYAQLITSEPAAIVKLGPAYLAVLESLGMTPRARAALASKGGAGGDGHDELEEMRRVRADRKRRAAAVDSPTP